MLLRKLASVVGMATVDFGVFSCDNGGTSGRICCTFTNDYDETITACEGDMYSFGDRSYELTGYWWNGFKEEFVYYYGGTCS